MGTHTHTHTYTHTHTHTHTHYFACRVSWRVQEATEVVLGRELLKIVRPSERRLASTQPRSVETYNEIVEKQFLLHRIPERMDGRCGQKSRICGTPTPPW